MSEEFRLKDDDEPTEAQPPLSSEQQDRLDRLMARMVSPEEHLRLEALLLERLKRHKPELEEMLKTMNGHWAYEDNFYRYYHSSWTVYGTQTTTEKAVALLRKLQPECKLNPMFEDIMGEGTGKTFELEHNRDWERHTRPMLEAFCHAKFMIEMAVRYADLPKPPQPMPSGWAALLYLFGLR
jgi:hypothetical protein